MKIVAHRRRWYSLSLIVLLPLVVALFVFGLKLGIDFTGGAVIEINSQLSPEQIRSLAAQSSINNPTITVADDNRQIIRYVLQEQETSKVNEFENNLRSSGADILLSDQIGPSVSDDLRNKALLSVVVLSLAVVAYISYAFRKTARVVRPFQFGLATVIAAFLHDALFVIGVFAVLGKFFNIEVDSFIITAILTVIGFSIHDTIVVFDRIREKLQVDVKNFAETAEESLQETLVRSLNTSFVIILVLLALLLFGGVSTRYFVLALLLGMLAGTYSSIFIAAPLLVNWHEWTTHKKHSVGLSTKTKTKKIKKSTRSKKTRTKS
jgi:preprotein translocase subunit SecF